MRLLVSGQLREVACGIKDENRQRRRRGGRVRGVRSATIRFVPPEGRCAADEVEVRYRRADGGFSETTLPPSSASGRDVIAAARRHNISSRPKGVHSRRR